MIETILFGICLLFAILGLGEVLHSLRLKLLSIKPTPKSFYLISLPPSFPQLHLKFAAEKYCWEKRCEIIALDTFVEAKDLEECQEIARKNNITLCSFEELGEHIKA